MLEEFHITIFYNLTIVKVIYQSCPMNQRIPGDDRNIVNHQILGGCLFKS